MSGEITKVQEGFLAGLGAYFSKPKESKKPALDPRDLAAKHQVLLTQLDLLSDIPDFARGHSTTQALAEAAKQVRAAFAPNRLEPDLEAAEQAIEAVKSKLRAEAERASARRKSLQESIEQLKIPADVGDQNSQIMAAEKEKALVALKADPPAVKDLQRAARALENLEVLSKRPAIMAALQQRDLEAAKFAAAALAKLDAQIAEFSDADCENEPRIQEKRDAVVAARKWLTNAVGFGPLSPDAAHAFKPETARKLLASCVEDPAFGVPLAKIAATATYPDEIAENIGTVVELTRTEPSESKPLRDPAKYAQDLLRMGGEMGPGYFERLTGYLKSGRQFQPNPFSDKSGDDTEMRAQKRCAMVASRLVKPVDGKASLDLSSEGATEALDDLLFHPDAVGRPMPALNAHVLKTVEMLGTNQDRADGVLRGIIAPTDLTAQTLVRNAMPGQNIDPVDAVAAGTAVLGAMLRPFDQGQVGSCFATGATRRMREQQPIKAMKACAMIATTGTYKPPNGPAVQAVTNTQRGNDPILRSWEFSLATSTAAKAGSNEHTRFAASMANATGQLTGETGLLAFLGGPSAKVKKLNADIAAASSFVYDPDADVTLSADGSSSKGRFVLTLNGREVRDRAAFEEAVTEIALASLKIKANTPDAAKLGLAVKGDEFINAVCQNGLTPWELPSGGLGKPVAEALYGGPNGVQVQAREVLPRATKPSSTTASGDDGRAEGDRMMQMLTGVLQNYGAETRAMVPVETEGIHCFNVLPNDPSMQALKGPSADAIKANLEKTLLAPGQKMKDATFPTDRAAWLFDEEISAAAEGYPYPGREELLEEAVLVHRPKGPMTPKQLATVINDALQAHAAALGEAQAKEWESDRKEKNDGAEIDPEELAQKRKELLDKAKRNTLAGAKGRMLRELDGPQIVMADTNWGSAANHTFFVVAADPTTGQPMLFQREDPPGTLTAPSQDWVDTKWFCFQ